MIFRRLPSDEPLSNKNIRNFLIRWNQIFFFDLIWRRKYKIPFLSEEHKNMSLIGMFYDFMEDKLLKESMENRKRLDDKFENQLLKLHDLDFEEVKMTREEVNEDFDNLKINE